MRKNLHCHILSITTILECIVYAYGNIGNEPALKVKYNQMMTPQKRSGFLENKGQMTDADGNPAPYVLFKAEVTNLNIWVTTSGLTYQFFKMEDRCEEKEQNVNSPKQAIEKKDEKITGEWHRVDMILKGASINKQNILTESDITQGRIDYYLGHCPDGIFDVKTYSKIIIKEVYKGIDWVLYTSGGVIKHDFIIQPHADPKQIKLIYEGCGKLNVENNHIYFKNKLGDLTEGNLLCYQEIKSNIISSNYIMHKNESTLYLGPGNFDHTRSSLPINEENEVEIFSSEVEIEIQKYDTNNQLIIDPQLIWATFYGANGVDGPTSAATDAVGNLFVTGYTGSANFPSCSVCPKPFQGTIAGAGDVFILKFNNTGVLQWTTYYGGSNWTDLGFNIVTDVNGNVLVTGYTSSVNFPVCTTCPGYLQGTNAGMTDAFILKFDNNGNRLWATYYGGSLNEGLAGSTNYGISITTDAGGNVFVTGCTESVNFPVCTTCPGYFQGTNAGFYDAFILKFDNNGNRLWATYYGGQGSDDGGNSITTDSNGNVFITGFAGSFKFPVCTTCPGYFQAWAWSMKNAFILKFDNNGNRLWATYYGGTRDDEGNSIATDVKGNVFVMGTTQSIDFPLCTNCPGYLQGTKSGMPGWTDAFILKFDNNGNRLWSTYYGGNKLESTASYDNIAIDNCGNIYISFTTSSTDLPLQNSCDAQYFDNSYNGNNADIAIVMFSNNGNRLWATYLGGDGIDIRSGLAVDNRNNLFFVGEWTWLANAGTYPITNPGGGAYFDPTFNGSTRDDDGCILKFTPLPLIANITLTQPQCGNPCSGSARVNITSPTACTYTFLWSNGQTNQTATGLCGGVYTVNITNELCRDTMIILFITTPTSCPIIANVNSATKCSGAASCPTLSATGIGGTLPYTYLWNTSATSANINPCPINTTNYTVTITDSKGIASITTATVTINPAITINSDPTHLTCSGGTNGSILANPVNGIAPYTYSWSNGLTTQTITGLSQGNYVVQVTDSKGCTSSSTTTINSPQPITGQFTKGTSNCNGCSCKEWIMVNAIGGTSPYSYYWPDGYLNRYRNQLCPSTYMINIKDKNGCSVNVNLTAP